MHKSMALIGAAIILQTNPPFHFWLETLSIFVGDVLAVIVVGVGGILLLQKLKKPGFRIKVDWQYIGWDLQKMKRLPNEWDSGNLVVVPMVTLTSHDMAVQKIISVLYVRERADLSDPGDVRAHLELATTMTEEARTTAYQGNPLLKLRGPEIPCQANNARRITQLPVFVETNEGEIFLAEKPGAFRSLNDAKEHIIRRLS